MVGTLVQAMPGMGPFGSMGCGENGMAMQTTGIDGDGTRIERVNREDYRQLKKLLAKLRRNDKNFRDCRERNERLIRECLSEALGYNLRTYRSVGFIRNAFNCLTLQPRARWGLNIHEQNEAYTVQNHEDMCDDKIRVTAFTAALNRLVGGKRVLDVGTGPFALLSCIALRAGAVSIDAIESNGKAVRHAIEMFEDGDEAMRRDTSERDSKFVEDREYYRGLDLPRYFFTNVRHDTYDSDRDRHSDRDSDQDSDRELGRQCGDRDRTWGRKWERDRDRDREQDRGTDMDEDYNGSGGSSKKEGNGGWCASPRGDCDISSGPEPGSTRPLAVPCATVELLPRDPTGPDADIKRTLSLFHGLSTEVEVAGGYDVVVHEILGHVASAEGVASAIQDIKSRGILNRNCVFIPKAAETVFSPTSCLDMSPLECIVSRYYTGYEDIVPKTKYHVRNFPESVILAPHQPLERIVFSVDSPVLMRQVHECEFRTTKAGVFDGLHFHMKVIVDDQAIIDTYATRTTWRTTYVRLLNRGVALAKGSRIMCKCVSQIDLFCPKYSIKVFIGEKGNETHVATYDWEGCS